MEKERLSISMNEINVAVKDEFPNVTHRFEPPAA
jgi:hypothetical protein